MTDRNKKEESAQEVPKTGAFVRFNLTVFFWCMTGVVGIYGVRLYHDVPIHPSFMPIIGAVFAAVLSFTLVITLRIVAGSISFKAGNVSLEGASGPIAFWCICFLAVCYGLYLLGFSDATQMKLEDGYISCSTDDVFMKQCPYKVEMRKGMHNPASVPSSSSESKVQMESIAK